MNKKEEITDMITDAAYDDPEFKKGLVLKFDYEGSKTSLKLTRVDRKNKRTWAEHINLIKMDQGMSHYGHEIDATQNPPYCTDCDEPVDQFANQDGNNKAWDRDEKKMEKLTGGKRK